MPKKKTQKKKQRPDPVLDGFHKELKTIIQSDEPLTPAKLNVLNQLVQSAQSILNIRNPRLQACRPTLSLGGGYMMGSAMGMGSTQDVEMVMNENDEEDGEGAETPAPTFALASPMGMDRETFGAKVLREIVGAVPQIARAAREDPAQLVHAIAAAKEQGLDDIAEELQARLLGTKIEGRAEAMQAAAGGASVLPMPKKKKATKKTVKRPAKKKAKKRA